MLQMDQERNPTHSLNTITIITEKILVKVTLMKKFTESLQLIPMSSQCQEEEDKQLMPTTDQERNPTHSMKELITITETRKTLEKEESMKKSTELLQLILTFSQCQEEEDKKLMLTMDLEKNLTHLWREKTLVKEVLMKKFTVLLLLIPMFSQCQEEEDKRLMPTMDPVKNLTHWSKEPKKILVKVTLMKKFTELLPLILMFFQCQEEELHFHMQTTEQMSMLIHYLSLKKVILRISKSELMFIQLLTI